MPPLIAFAGALGGLAVVRWAYKTAVRINRELEEARQARVAEATQTAEIPTLRRRDSGKESISRTQTGSFRGAHQREPGISRFRVWCCAPARNDRQGDPPSP